MSVVVLPFTGQVHDLATRQNFEFIGTHGLFDVGVATTTAPGAGGAGALPATPAGYLTVVIKGKFRKIPYY